MRTTLSAAILDPEDYPRLAEHKWHIQKSAHTCYAKGYVPGRQKKKYTNSYMHRLIIPIPDGMVIDHINHNGLDNRKANLRLATRTQNNRHTRRIRNPGTSKYKGVSWYGREKKWVVKIHADGKTHTVGYFTDEIQAAKAYDKAAKELHGQFASLNFEP